MAKYKLKQDLFEFGIVTEEYANYEQYSNDCNEMENLGFALITETKDSLYKRKYALYLKFNK